MAIPPRTLGQVKRLDSRLRDRPEANHADVTEPWFRRRPHLTVAVAMILYAGVLVLRWLVAAPEPITLLFCFPIALLAVAFGLRAGLVAGLGGVVLLAVWATFDGVELSLLGWVTRAAPMLLLGGLLGHAADQLRRSEADRNRLISAAQRHRDAVGFNDEVVQELAAAKWAFEAGHPDRGLDIVTNTLDAAQSMVSQMLRDADAESGGRPGRRPTSWR